MDQTNLIRDAIFELWQEWPKNTTVVVPPTSAVERILNLVLLVIAVALGNALVVLLKGGLPTSQDGRRKSAAQVE